MRVEGRRDAVGNGANACSHRPELRPVPAAALREGVTPGGDAVLRLARGVEHAAAGGADELTDPVVALGDRALVFFLTPEPKPLLVDRGRSSRSTCYKRELVRVPLDEAENGLAHGGCFRAYKEARLAIFEWVEVCYQRKRIHGSLGQINPEAFEATAKAR